MEFANACEGGGRTAVSAQGFFRNVRFVSGRGDGFLFARFLLRPDFAHDPVFSQGTGAGLVWILRDHSATCGGNWTNGSIRKRQWINCYVG